jgi:heptosyltransferase-2
MTSLPGKEPCARILVRCPNWLGDLVMSTPGFRALRHRFPDSRIVAQVAAPLAPLLDGHPAFDEVWTLPGRLRELGRFRSEAQHIAQHHFDLGIVIPESISSALLMRAGRVGMALGYARDPIRRRLLHREVPAEPGWGRRRLVSRERFVLRLMAAVGASSEEVRLELAVTPDEELRLARAVQRASGDAADRPLSPPVVLAPGASFGPSKCWPIESFAELADRIAREGERIVLIGTSAERTRVEAVRDRMREDSIALAGALDLGALKALLRGARLLVSNDAGARHIAVAFGTPALVFFGPTAVEKTNENLESLEILETEHACRPCYRRSCPIDHRCLRGIGVEEAFEAVGRALRRGAAASQRRIGDAAWRWASGS